MNITEEIKKIIFIEIEKLYRNYLKSNKILKIKENRLTEIIKNFYEENNKSIKQKIRTSLKEKYQENYPNASVENIILEIFQDKDLNLNKIIDEIKFIQKKNHISLELPIINNSLNLNISAIDNYIVINSVKTNIENDIYDTVSKYKFIYSINNKYIEDYNTDQDKINIIKNEIKDKSKVEIELYYIKNTN